MRSILLSTGLVADSFGYHPDAAFHALLENGVYVLLTITALAVLSLGIGLAGLAVQMHRGHPMRRSAWSRPGRPSAWRRWAS